MSFLPIAARELRIAAVRSSTYYGRMLAGLAAASLSLAILFAGWSGTISPSAAGQVIFYSLSLVGYIFIALNGALVTADCISSERRDGTIGLLFLTDLKGYDIVVGKLFSRSLSALFWVLAALPAPALAFVLGGVGFADYAKMMLVLLNVLFLATTVGVWCSVLCVSDRKALTMALAITCTVVFLVPLAGVSLFELTNRSELSWAFFVFGPGGSFLGALGPGSGFPAANLFLPSLLITHFMGWAALISASLLLPSRWRQDPKEGPVPLRKRMGEYFRTRFVVGISGRTEYMSDNPVLWSLDQRRRGLKLYWSLFIPAVLGGAWLIYWRTISEPRVWLLLVIMAVVLNYVLKLEIVIRACRALREAKSTGVLELLLTTPLTHMDIVRGHLLAMKRQFLWPVLLLLAFEAILIWAKSGDGLTSGDQIALILGFFLFVLAQVAEMYAVAWVGLWMGLTSTSFARAVQKTVFRTLALQWLILLCCAAALSALMATTRKVDPTGIAVFLFLVWALGQGAAVLGPCTTANNGLRDDFRAISAVPVSVGTGKAALLH